MGRLIGRLPAALCLAALLMPTPDGHAQQVYSFADIMAALTVRLPAGETVTAAQLLTLQDAVRSLTLEQAVRTPANVARVAGVMVQARRDDGTRQAVRDGIGTALDSLVTGGQLAPLGRDLMMEQVDTALGWTTPGATAGPPPPAPADSASPTAATQRRPPTSPLVAPEPPTFPTPRTQTPTPPLTSAREPPVPRAAPVRRADSAALPPVHLDAPIIPPMPHPVPYAGPAGVSAGIPGAAQTAPEPSWPAASTPNAPSPNDPWGTAATAPPYVGASPPYASVAPSPYPTPYPGSFPESGGAQSSRPWGTPWEAGAPLPGQALFPTTINPGTLMDLPPEVTAPPTTLADSGS